MSDEAKIILKDMQIEEMRKEIISQDQFIPQLEKEYEKEIERLNEELKQAKEIALNEHKYASEMEDKYITSNNIINELKWKPIEKYDKGNYDWVLVKYFDGNYECVPCVAEKRFGKWHSIDEKEIKFDVKYFMDMQQIDKLQELKGSNDNG